MARCTTVHLAYDRDGTEIEDSPTGTASALAAGCRVLAVPVAAPLHTRPGLTTVASLAGLTLTDLRAVWSGY